MPNIDDFVARCVFPGVPVTRYLADAIAATFSDIALLPGRPDEEMLRRGLEDLRALDRHPGAWVRFVIHKAQARA
jgi:hypothetical protein